MALDGTVVAMGRGGAITHLLHPDGRARSAQSVSEALHALRASPGADACEAVLASVGFSGITPDWEETVRGWVRSVFPVERVLVSGDAPVNLAGAGEVGPRTVVVIAGGGSVAWAVGPDGREVASGGWAHIFGDEGSGWHIGRNAVAAALRALDGRGPATSLGTAIAGQFNVPDVGAVKALYHSGRIGDPDVAGLVRLVVRAAEAGDLAARTLLADAGRELGLAACAVIRRLGWERDVPEVVATGGVFKAGVVLWDSFCATIRDAAPAARIHRARFDPMIGAALLALRALGAAVSPALYDRIEQSLTALS